LHKVHSKVCRSVPEKCPARCGRASSEHGTSDRQDVQSPRAARWTTAVEIGAYASFEQASVQHSRSPRMSRGPSGNATVCRSGYRLAVQYRSISETCFRFFLAICFPKKRTARLSPAVQVREETPQGKGSDGGGRVAIAYPILQIERSRALTRLNFLLTFRVLSGDRSYCCRSRRRDTGTLFQKECSDNPNRFRNKTSSCLRLRVSIEGGYPEIEND
jgi:hypothetical protein